MNLTHTLSNSRATHFALRVLAVTLLLIGGFALKGHPVSAATQNAVASIYEPVTHQLLASGGSATPFTVVLPAGAACSGDTQSGGYHVSSYLLKSGTDPSTLTFSGGFPTAGHGLFNAGGYYGTQNTAANTGQVVSIPNDFQWSFLTASGTPLSDLLYSGTSGVWESGLLCTDTNGQVTDWWNTEVTFTAADSGTDANGFTWAATPGGGITPAAPTTTTTAPKTRVTTTTKPHVTTTTKAGTDDPVTTTTTAGDPTATTVVVSGAGASPIDPVDASGDFSDPTAVGGTLPRTGSPVNREVGLGLLAIGAGMMIIGLEWRWKARGAFAA